MKKIFLSIGCLISLSLFSQSGNTNKSPGTTTVIPGGGKINTTPVDNTAVSTPAIVTSNFSRDFPGAQVTWSMEGKNHRGLYIDPVTHLQHIIIYDPNGNVIRRESELEQGSYPASINDFYNKNHPNETYNVWETKDAKGKRGYYSKYKDEMQWYDSVGKPVNKAKTKEELKKKPESNKK
jgi:hypothetical protein